MNFILISYLLVVTRWHRALTGLVFNIKTKIVWWINHIQWSYSRPLLLLLIGPETLNAIEGMSVSALNCCLQLINFGELPLDFIGISKSWTLFEPGT